MFKRIRAILLPVVFVVMAALLGANPQRSFACFCVPEGSPSQELAQSSAVFSGRVIDIEHASASIRQNVESVNVTFQVSEVWKGPRRHTVTVLTARQGIDCGYEFESGQEYLVYARGAEERLVVWFCSRTQPLASAGEDLAVLGAGNAPTTATTSGVGIEIHASGNLAGQRETSQAFAYFVDWSWLWDGDQLSRERVGYAFWNSPDKAPIVSSLLWHGTVYGGRVEKGAKLALVEKIGNNARMTGPWEFFGDDAYRITVEDKPLVAELIDSHVVVHGQGVTAAGSVDKYTVRAGDTLSKIARTFGTTVSAIAQANNIVDPNLIVVDQVLVIPTTDG